MMKLLTPLTIALSLLVTVSTSSAISPADEKAFVDAYKKAFEGKDGKKLESFLYVKNADPSALEFYKMMMTSDMGGKISKIELRDLTADEIKEASAVLPGPTGDAKLPVMPSKKLVYKIDTSGPNGTSTSSSESFVAEVDGKLMIPVPGPVK